jgi:hypothetical protein
MTAPAVLVPDPTKMQARAPKSIRQYEEQQHQLHVLRPRCRHVDTRNTVVEMVKILRWW